MGGGGNMTNFSLIHLIRAKALTPCLTGKSLDLPRPDGHAWSTIVRRWWSGGPPWWGLLTPPFIINFLVKVITHHYYHHWDHSSTRLKFSLFPYKSPNYQLAIAVKPSLLHSNKCSLLNKISFVVKYDHCKLNETTMYGPYHVCMLLLIDESLL